MANYLTDVRNQYEALPYPHRDPEDESKRLLITGGDLFEYLNHYAYGGQIDLSDFKVLVAGGGTGDSTIHLAEQLRHTDNQVVHLDLSEASIAIAKERARIRKLDNITFIHGSILDLPDMDLGLFHYINCSGVLHHLADPTQGLKALHSVLCEDGVMNIMVYALYGRAMVYHVQSLMRELNGDNSNIESAIKNTRELLAATSHTPWSAMLKFNPISNEIEHAGDAGLYDLFLHSQDRAYSVPQLYDWVEEAGLSLSHWVNDPIARYKRLFSPDSVRNPHLQSVIETKPKRQQEAILEMIHGTITKHAFYASRGVLKEASADNETMIPDYSFFIGRDQAAEDFASLKPEHDGQKVQLNRGGEHREFAISDLSRTLLQLIDGQRSIAAIIDEAYEALKPNRAETFSRQNVQEAFATLYNEFNACDWLLLRHPSLERWPTHTQLHAQMKDG